MTGHWTTHWNGMEWNWKLCVCNFPHVLSPSHPPSLNYLVHLISLFIIESYKRSCRRSMNRNSFAKACFDERNVRMDDFILSLANVKLISYSQRHSKEKVFFSISESLYWIQCSHHHHPNMHACSLISENLKLNRKMLWLAGCRGLKDDEGDYFLLRLIASNSFWFLVLLISNSHIIIIFSVKQRRCQARTCGKGVRCYWWDCGGGLNGKLMWYMIHEMWYSCSL